MSYCVLFSPPFFEYPSIIANELRKHFDYVTYIPSTPQNLLWKYVGFYNKERLKDWYLAQYYKTLINKFRKIHKSIDCFIIIKGSLIPDFFYSWIKANNPKARFIQYLWDNISTDDNALRVSLYFEKTLSFSTDDCEKYGFLFRPFFFINLMEQEKSYDIAFIGSLNLIRCNMLNMILERNPYLSKRCLQWHIKGSNLLAKKLGDATIRRLHKFISSKPLLYNDMISILAKSKAQIDIPNEKQTGLTTRAFESLGTHTKIITTNCHIAEYDFYNPDNILIIDKSNPVIPEQWLDLSYKQLPDEILAKYTLRQFVVDIIS